MSVASSQQSFLINILAPTHKPQKGFLSCVNTTVCCRHQIDEDVDRDSPRKRKENKLAKLAMVALAAGALTLGSVQDAEAAKSGGRVGGQAFRSSGPRVSAPRNNNSRTNNIYINPRVAPPLVGGYGYGYGVPFYGGWGWSPFSFFAPGPGPSAAVAVGGGFDTLALFLFLGAAAAVVRRFFRSRNDYDDEEY